MGEVQYFRTENEVNEHIKCVEKTSMSRFVLVFLDKKFKTSDWQPHSKCKIYWEWEVGPDACTPSIPFSGMPFVFIGAKRMGCHQGKDRCLHHKKRYAQSKANLRNQKNPEEIVFKRGRTLNYTKKIGCPALITISRIAKFPSFMLTENRERNRKETASRLRLALQRDPVIWEDIYFVRTPHPSVHICHAAFGEATPFKEPVDEKVEQLVKELTMQGVRRCDMRQHISQFVKNCLFGGDAPPPLNKRQFYPVDKDIRKIMAVAREEERQSKIEQSNLQAVVEKQKLKAPDDLFHLQKSSQLDGFLFCYQTAWQQRLLCLYGNSFCLLDSGYKAIRNTFPLHFLYVRTNVSYTIVGVFVVPHATTEAIKEALTVFKRWNKTWTPLYVVVDHSRAETEAVETVFEGTEAIYCDFHYEKSWVKWIRKQSHVVADKEGLLTMLKTIADVQTTEEYSEAVKELTESETWKNNCLLRNWFTNTWMSEVKRWANVFKSASLTVAIKANSGSERLHEVFKQRFLEGHKQSTVSNIITLIIDDYIPTMHKKYAELNAKAGCEQYSKAVPAFLRNRPKEIVQHVMNKMKTSLGRKHVEHLEHGVFKVQCATEQGVSYVLNFGGAGMMPWCQCDDWKKNLLPCEHFCAVFQAVPDWSWDNLSPLYRGLPLFNIDSACIQNISDTCLDLHTTEDVSTRTLSQKPDLPIRKRTHKTALRQQCVAKLKSVLDLVNMVDEDSGIARISEKLDDLRAMILTGLPEGDEPKRRRSQNKTLPA